MAVERKNKGPAAQSPAAQAPQTSNMGGAAQQPQPNHQPYQEPAMNQNTGGRYQGDVPPKPQQPGFMSINSMFRRSGATERSEVRSAQALQALKEAQKEAVETQSVTDDHQLLRFDRDQNQVGLSSVLVCKAMNNGGETHIAVRVLLLETDVTLPKRRRDMGHQRLEMPSYAQDVFNGRYWDRVEKFVRDHFGRLEAVVHNAGPLLIPDYTRSGGFDFANHDDVTRVLTTSVNRLDDVLLPIMGEKPFRLADLKSADDRLRLSIETRDDHVEYDVVNTPHRSDITVLLTSSNVKPQHEDDYYENSIELSKVSAYVNVEYVRPDPNMMQPQQYGMQPQRQFYYVPAIVATRIAAGSEVRFNTPEIYLLALSNLYRVLTGMTWVNTLRPRVGENDPDPKDIGALTYLVNGSKAPIKQSAKPEQFIEFMNEMIYPQPSLMIDIDPLGENSLVESYFVDAAFDGPNRYPAKMKIFKAVQNLTNDAFGKYFDINKDEIVVPTNQIIQLGHYPSANGDIRDARDLDTLAMLNYTQGNTADFDDWYTTYVSGDSPQDPIEQQLNRRERIARVWLSPNLHIRGRAHRLIVTSAFADALDQATVEAGVNVSMEDVSEFVQNRFMGNTQIMDYTMNSQPRMNSYQQPGSPVGAQYYAGNAGGGRYTY